MSEPENTTQLAQEPGQPHTGSEEGAEERASDNLRQIEASGDLATRVAHEDNVATGHKTVIANSGISDEAKEHSAQVLEDMGRS
ncbi:hypothetical protein BC628DRAFT_1380592 [Trametes gibbosa]|nr:hypothetical protein BC628DRAFT_1380592 [Trametes gibbosa]